MMFLKIILIILAIIGLLLLIKEIGEYFYFRKEIEKRSDGKRYCNHCKFAFTHPHLDDFNYCPVCGRELEYIKILDENTEEEK